MLQEQSIETIPVSLENVVSRDDADSVSSVSSNCTYTRGEPNIKSLGDQYETVEHGNKQTSFDDFVGSATTDGYQEPSVQGSLSSSS